MRGRSRGRTVVAVAIATSLATGAAYAGDPGEPAWPPPVGQTPPPPSPPVLVPPDESRRHVYQYWDTDKTFMLVGAGIFVVSCGLPVAFLLRFGGCDPENPSPGHPDADRCNAANRRFLIPVVGPWLAYEKEPVQGDVSRDPKVAILLGSAQLFGIATFLIGATGNAHFFAPRRRQATLNVAPVTARDWAGLGLNGSF